MSRAVSTKGTWLCSPECSNICWSCDLGIIDIYIPLTLLFLSLTLEPLSHHHLWATILSLILSVYPPASQPYLSRLQDLPPSSLWCFSSGHSWSSLCLPHPAGIGFTRLECDVSSSPSCWGIQVPATHNIYREREREISISTSHLYTVCHRPPRPEEPPPPYLPTCQTSMYP